MPFITWDNCYSVFVPEMDEEHKNIIKIINQLDEAIHEEKEREITGDIISQLIEYCKTHFAHEEQFLSEIGYPKLEKHQGLHTGLSDVTKLFQNEYNAGQTVSAEKLMVFLWNWLLDHIMSEDKAYGLFYAENNLKKQETQEVLIK